MYFKRLSIIISIIFFLLGCSNINVRKFFLGNEVHTIDNWKLDYIKLPANDSGSKELLPELKGITDINGFNSLYVNEIGEVLSNSYNINSFENIVSTGTILLEIYPSNKFSFPDTKYSVKEYSKQDYDNERDPDVPIEPIVLIDKEAPINRIKSDVKVTFMKIYFLNVDKHIIGEIHLTSDKIKPKHVAKILAEKVYKK